MYMLFRESIVCYLTVRFVMGAFCVQMVRRTYTGEKRQLKINSNALG